MDPSMDELMHAAIYVSIDGHGGNDGCFNCNALLDECFRGWVLASMDQLIDRGMNRGMH